MSRVTLDTLYSFTDPEIKQALIDLVGISFVEDIILYLAEKNKAKNQITLYGDHEDESADILVPKTGHKLTDAYISVIAKLL